MKRFLQTLALVAALLPLGAEMRASEPVEKYFARYLSGDLRPYAGRGRLRGVNEAREAVWAAWCAANAAADEEALPPLGPLAESDTAVWHLPAALEPDAQMRFRWGAKGDSVPAEGLPLFIQLHGSGPRDSEWAANFALAQRFDDAPSAYFVPQIPREGEWYRWYHRSKQWAWEKLLRRALASGAIDPDRIYLFGISEGAYGSQRLASLYADYLAGAGPMAGGEILYEAPPVNLRHTAFSLLTGADDYMFGRDLLTARVAAELDSLQALHPGDYDHRVELIPGRGHHIDYSPTTPWLAARRREARPRDWTWEDFALDGRHRRGFYNLQIDERPDSTRRTLYDVSISGNDIAITVNFVDYEPALREPRWNIPVVYRRTLTPATGGAMTLYLDETLVDLSRPVRVSINGRTAFSGRLKPDLAALVNSCALFGDPRRLYPVALPLRS